MSLGKVSYYAHHAGTGHMRHAQKIASTNLFHLQVTSTEGANCHLVPDRADYVSLVSDIPPTPSTEARGSPFLHYAPTGAHISERFAKLNQAWLEFAPDLVMVDVSVEVALFAKLSGYRVALRRMPGERADLAHQLGYSVADALFAYYPRALEDPGFDPSNGTETYYLAQPQPPAAREIPSKDFKLGHVVVQTSLAAALDLDQLVQAAAQTPYWVWEVLGSVRPGNLPVPQNLKLHGVVEDPLRWMTQAQVVISSAGHNAVAAAAASGRPVLLIPEDRPFSEQHAFARQLHRTATVPMLNSWRTPVKWPEVLENVASSDPAALAQALFVTEDTFSSRVADMFLSLTKQPQ